MIGIVNKTINRCRYIMAILCIAYCTCNIISIRKYTRGGFILATLPCDRCVVSLLEIAASQGGRWSVVGGRWVRGEARGSVTPNVYWSVLYKCEAGECKQ